MAKGRKNNDNFFRGNMNFFDKRKLIYIGIGILLIIFLIFRFACSSSEEPTLEKTKESTKVAKEFVPKKYNFTVTDEIQITSDFIKYKTRGRISSIESAYIAYCAHKYAPKFGLDVSFVIAKMYAESTIDPSQVNASTGATGILQVLDKGIGCDKTGKNCKITFDEKRLHDIDHGTWAGLMVFADKMKQVRTEIKKNPKIKNKRNYLVMAMTKYVGASSKEGMKKAKRYTEQILRVQAEYVLFRSTYCKDSVAYFEDVSEER